MVVYGIQREAHFLIHSAALRTVLVLPADHIALQAVHTIYNHDAALVARWISTVAVQRPGSVCLINAAVRIR